MAKFVDFTARWTPIDIGGFWIPLPVAPLCHNQQSSLFYRHHLLPLFRYVEWHSYSLTAQDPA